MNLLHRLIHKHWPTWRHYHNYEQSENWCVKCKGEEYNPSFSE